MSYNTLRINTNDITVSGESEQQLMDQSSHAMSHETDNSNEGTETPGASSHSIALETGPKLMPNSDQSSDDISRDTDCCNEGQTPGASSHSIALDPSIATDSDDTKPQLNESLNTVSHDAETTGASSHEITPDMRRILKEKLRKIQQQHMNKIEK
ncbi:unnamed protein product [Oppiella nova]|uniref:Uncharacterized protein n=1 Tax=Oppiella nova TaxID=334625 RepID=A0A7R9LC02_9ACAR|nr:unnamed protein product [Oppiella nova]CAG2161882.1 unnamed protein product [Oppiella nova]